MRLAALTFDDLKLRDDIKRLAAATLTATERGGGQCSAPAGVEEPGLLTGVAGFGWGWLELADAGRDGDSGDGDSSSLPAPYAVAVTLHGERVLLGAANRSGGPRQRRGGREFRWRSGK